MRKRRLRWNPYLPLRYAYKMDGIAGALGVLIERGRRKVGCHA